MTQAERDVLTKIIDAIQVDFITPEDIQSCRLLMDLKLAMVNLRCGDLATAHAHLNAALKKIDGKKRDR